MKGALDVHRELLALDLPHEIVRLRRSVLGAEEIPEVLGLPAGVCVSVRAYVVVADGRPDRLVAVGVPAGQVADPAALLTALDACAVRAATDEQVNAATEFSAPLVPPVALPDEVELLLDAAFEAAEVVYTPTGEAGTALGIRLRDLVRATRARVVPLTGAAAGLAALGRPVAAHADPVDAELARLLGGAPG